MSEITNNVLSYSVDSEGIALITIDQKNNPANLYSLEFTEVFYSTASKAIKDAAVKGVIVTSGQKMFMPGGDLRWLAKPIEDAQAFFDGIMNIHKNFRELETAGKPFVAAINGTALGGGMELCLNCHHRIVINDVKIKLGFPESKVGLLPGGGGTAKLPYLLGIQNALMYLLKGTEVRPQQALKDGLVHQLADSNEDLIAKAKNWIIENPNPIQPWDDKKHKLPGGGFWTPNGVQTIIGSVGNVSKMSHGNYPSLKNILSIVHDGLQIPIDRALEIEARYFTKACQSPEAKNMIRTGFLGLQAAKKGKARPKEQPKYAVNKLGIIGAGMMGSGIAYVSAKAGMEVVLKDISVEAAEKGKSYSKKILDKAITRNRSTPEKAKRLLDNIYATDDASAVEGCDLVIEAVFEDPQLKDKVSKETESVLGNDKIYASNTSTIPISFLAQSIKRPENFIGIHFFSPVEKMPLVEIIIGEKSSDKAIAAAVDYAVAIGKIPIVVNDSRGFFTSRCFGTFVNEGMFLLEEGVPAALIENIARKKGMPVGPLAVHDEVSLSLTLHVIESDPTEQKSEDVNRAYKITKNLVENYNRIGKKEGKGFYDYPKNTKKKLWNGLKEIFKPDVNTLGQEIVSKRIMHRQALESVRCLDEGVLNSVVDGDIGSVLGWGFPIYTGGAISYVDYIGAQQFVEDCDQFKSKFGLRWEVPSRLREIAEKKLSIQDYLNEKQSA